MSRETDEQRLCDEAVDWFAAEMKAKLREKAKRGWTGWRTERYAQGERSAGQICDHVKRMLLRGKPEEVDVANLCMFRAHYRHRGEAAKAAKEKR